MAVGAGLIRNCQGVGVLGVSCKTLTEPVSTSLHRSVPSPSGRLPAHRHMFLAGLSRVASTASVPGEAK